MRLLRFLLIWLVAAFGCFTLEAIAIALWQIHLAGHGRTSWLNQERIFPLIGPSTPLDVIAVLSSLAVGLIVALILSRRRPTT